MTSSPYIVTDGSISVYSHETMKGAVDWAKSKAALAPNKRLRVFRLAAEIEAVTIDARVRYVEEHSDE